MGVGGVPVGSCVCMSAVCVRGWGDRLGWRRASSSTGVGVGAGAVGGLFWVGCVRRLPPPPVAPSCCVPGLMLLRPTLHPACRCRQLQEVLPAWLPSRWLKVFSQQWEGDVTIVLPHTFLQLWKALVNPSNAGGWPWRGWLCVGVKIWGGLMWVLGGWACMKARSGSPGLPATTGGPGHRTHGLACTQAETSHLHPPPCRPAVCSAPARAEDLRQSCPPSLPPHSHPPLRPY